jgi:selenophosphate synthetase-related protein
MSERTKAIISASVILLVNIAAIFGVSLDYDVWFSGLCAIVMLAADIYAIWKNHNFTSEAAEAQAYLDKLKAEERG